MTATKPPFWQPYWEHNNAMAARCIDTPAPPTRMPEEYFARRDVVVARMRELGRENAAAKAAAAPRSLLRDVLRALAGRWKR
jgi:hypothetical protein